LKSVKINKKNDHDIIQYIIKSIENSEKKGYHAKLKKEEFSNPFIELDKLILIENGEIFLINDESIWKECLENRWGFTTYPEYLNNTKYPFKSFYLQNHVQDFILDLNNILDFKKYHQTLELVSDFIIRLEISMINPTNIKSKFHFITIFLTKLKNLETLIIKKGEISLINPAFKCLVKGLSNSSGSLNSLILQNCNIDPESIKNLMKTTTSISGNLKKLILRSNPLGDQGNPIF
jgi:hypothetical protein